jgi:hypothetical protein
MRQCFREFEVQDSRPLARILARRVLGVMASFSAARDAWKLRHDAVFCECEPFSGLQLCSVNFS